MGSIQFLILICFAGVGVFLMFHFNAENLLRRKSRKKRYKYYFPLALGILLLPLAYFLYSGANFYTILMIAAGAMPMLYLLVFEFLRIALFSDSKIHRPVLVSNIKGLYGRMDDGYKPNWKEKFFSVAIFSLPLLFFILVLLGEVMV